MLKQVFLINTDLSMRKGKIAVQVAHGEVYYMEIINSHELDVFNGKALQYIFNRYNRYCKWSDNNMTKIILKATEEQMDKVSSKLCFKKIWCHEVHDKGYTQVEPDSFTCLVVEPLDEELYNELFKQFKLL